MAKKRGTPQKTVRQKGAAVERESRECSVEESKRLTPTIGHYEWDSKKKIYRTVTA